MPHDRRRSSLSNSDRIANGALWLIIAICCGLPLLWLIWQIVANPGALVELHQDSFRLWLLGRTLLYNGLSAVIATLMAIPAALALGRGQGRNAGALWLVLPISLLMPSIAFTYGWKLFFFRLNGGDFYPAGPKDVMRCIWTLATWLWPLPAGLIGISLRQMDTQVQEQAMIDGALWRTTLRQLAGPILAGFCLVTVLATQEFAVYEPTGISVVATEMRMVFETGAYSSASNPITQQMGFNGMASPDQPHRAAAAAATAMPLLIVIGALVGVAMWQGRRLSAIEGVETGDWPEILNAPIWCSAVSWLLILITLAVPMLSMYLSLRKPFDIGAIYEEFAPQINGSIVIALVTGVMALLVSLLAAVVQTRVTVLLGAATFLIGGPLLAIGLIRIYNRPGFSWVYNGLPIIVMAYLARFGWIALLAGRATWGRAWRQLREMSDIDGASAWQTAVSVIWPIAWPILGAAGIMVMILSLTEVPATVLISPQNPQPLIPMMMQWVHIQRFDNMIEASLLLCAAVSLLAICATLLVMIARHRLPRTK